MAIAFFDLDKTLIAENSAKLWLKGQWRTNRIKLPQMVMASYWMLKYQLGFNLVDEVIQKGLSFIEGEQESTVLKQTEDFFSSTLKNLYRPGALDAIKKHRDMGQVTSLLTSSFDGLSILVQKDLQLDHCLCTHLEVDTKGFYTGKTVGPPCFGKNKVEFATNLCTKLNVPVADCTFYTDSASDIPFMDIVGQAIAVNPDPHLRARAQLEKWQIVDWGRPS